MSLCNCKRWSNSRSGKLKNWIRIWRRGRGDCSRLITRFRRLKIKWWRFKKARLECQFNCRLFRRKTQLIFKRSLNYKTQSHYFSLKLSNSLSVYRKSSNYQPKYHPSKTISTRLPFNCKARNRKPKQYRLNFPPSNNTTNFSKNKNK